MAIPEPYRDYKLLATSPGLEQEISDPFVVHKGELYDSNNPPKPDCADSNGVLGYHFLHYGYWAGDSQPIWGVSTDKACSELCSTTKECKGFSRDSNQKACYTYRSLDRPQKD